MSSPWSSDHDRSGRRRHLGRRPRRPARGGADQVALCLDFDGTLSPIVDDPEAAQPLAGVVERLGPPADRYAAVALISGRPAVPSDKGDAVRRVVAESGARSVVVAGDDLGDLAAFAAVAKLATEGSDGLRVAVGSAEAPPPQEQCA